ncbi:MAG: hypothetical protein GY769_07025 [bacterium]|nr:hypothetical protein [bacterium]
MEEVPPWAAAFREFCGEYRLRRFAVALTSSYDRGKLFYWQEQLVDSFVEKHGLTKPSLDDLLRACWPSVDPEDPDCVAPIE